MGLKILWQIFGQAVPIKKYWFLKSYNLKTATQSWHKHIDNNTDLI